MSLMSEMYPGLRREHDSEVGWRESYAKTNGFVAGDPEICHSHGGTSPAPSPAPENGENPMQKPMVSWQATQKSVTPMGDRGEHFLDSSVRMPPRPHCAVIFCSLLTLLETYQSSLLGNI